MTPNSRLPSQGGIKFAPRRVGDMAKKVAVIADDHFADEQQRLADSFPGASVRFFPPAKAEQAIAWLQGRPSS